MNKKTLIVTFVAATLSSGIVTAAPIINSCATANKYMTKSIAWRTATSATIAKYNTKKQKGYRKVHKKIPYSVLVSMVKTSPFCTLQNSTIGIQNNAPSSLLVFQYTQYGKLVNTRIAFNKSKMVILTSHNKALSISKKCGIPYELNNGGTIQLEGCTLGRGGTLLTDFITYIRSIKIF